MKTAKPEMKKTNINLKKLKIKLAKAVAYVSLIVSAAYGVRNMLENLEPIAQSVITIVLVIALVFIITLDEE